MARSDYKHWKGPKAGVEHTITPESNTLLSSLLSFGKERKSGISSNMDEWLAAITRAQGQITEDPTILDRYAITIEDDGGEKGTLTPRQHPHQFIIYYMANPWKFAEEVIGKDIMDMTAGTGGEFTGFNANQKRTLRAMLDPRKRYHILKCTRGGGKTLLTALLAAIAFYCFPKIKIGIVGGAEEQAKNLYNYFKTFVSAPAFKIVIRGEPLKRETLGAHGGKVIVMTASEKNVRNPRTDLLIMDETCQIDPVIMESAMPQLGTSKNLKLILLSTPDRIFHPFRDIWVGETIYSHYTRHTWNCYECDWIDPEFIAIQKATLSENRFRMEYLAEFGSASGTVFEARHVEAAMWDTRVKGFPETVMMAGEHYPIHFENNTQGIDWGWKHPTVLTLYLEDQSGMGWIISSDPYQYTDDSIIYAEAHKRAIEFGCRTLADGSAPDRVSSLKKILGESDLEIKPIPFNKWKAMMIDVLRAKLEKGQLKIMVPKCSELVNQLLAYSYEEHSDKPKKVKDDHVDSLMLATLPHRYSQIDYGRISKVNVADFIDVDGDIFRGLDEGGFSFGSGTKPKKGSGTLAGYRSSGYREGGRGSKKGWEL